MPTGRTIITRGCRVLTDAGTAVVTGWDADGIDFKNAFGDVEHVPWMALSDVRTIDNGMVEALTQPLRPLWDALDHSARIVALMRLEVVQEIVTGYRDGHPELARPDEPRCPFGPGFGLSKSRRCEEMAALLCQEKLADRVVQRRIRDGEIHSGGISSSTVRNWVRQWENEGLIGLIDGRSIHIAPRWDGIDEQFRDAVDRIINTLDGNPSTVSIRELDRRARVELREAGVNDLRTPQRKTQQYISWRLHTRGRTTRAQRSTMQREVSGTHSFEVVRPGQVVVIDATNADNLVFDALSGKAISVQILTAIDLATRVVLALRVVPLSANGLETMMMIYDVCRPFALAVEGTTIGSWRWCGLPEAVDLSDCQLGATSRVSVAPDVSALQGQHFIPAVLPNAMHADLGTNFHSMPVMALLGTLGIDVLPSRGGKPTDNPHMERWHETLQRGLQQIPGYKGRNVSQRGRLVAEEPLLTAGGLQNHLRQWVALDYHRSPHTGYVLPGTKEEMKARLCPLEIWDAMVQSTGRIDIPQQPDLIYQFLPIHWLTIRQAGVELWNLVYDSTLLDPYRHVPTGFFRAGDRAAPFFVDTNDLSRIWFRDPEPPHRVNPIEWRGAYQLNAPMTRSYVDAACQRIRQRGGNNVLTKDSATRQIVNELTRITDAPPDKKIGTKRGAAARRVEQSRADHEEAQVAQDRLTPAGPRGKMPLASIRRAWPDLLDDR